MRMRCHGDDEAPPLRRRRRLSVTHRGVRRIDDEFVQAPPDFRRLVVFHSPTHVGHAHVLRRVLVVPARERHEEGCGDEEKQCSGERAVRKSRGWSTAV